MHESEDGQNNQGNTLKSFHFFFYSECPIMLICKCIFRIILIFVLKLCCLRVLCIYPYIRKYVFGYFFMLECVCVCMFMSAHWKSILIKKSIQVIPSTLVFTLVQMLRLGVFYVSYQNWLLSVLHVITEDIVTWYLQTCVITKYIHTCTYKST